MAIDLNRLAALKGKLKQAQASVAETITAHVESSIETAAVAAYEKGLSVVGAVASVFTSDETHAAPAPKPATSAPATPPKGADEPKKS